jgi:hypothetical protein
MMIVVFFQVGMYGSLSIDHNHKTYELQASGLTKRSDLRIIIFFTLFYNIFSQK